MSFTRKFLLFCSKETVTAGCAMTSLSAGILVSRHLSHTLFSSTVKNWNLYPHTLAGKEIILPVLCKNFVFKLSILLHCFSPCSCSQSHRITESWNILGWKEYRRSSSTPDLAQDTPKNGPPSESSNAVFEILSTKLESEVSWWNFHCRKEELSTWLVLSVPLQV